MSDISNRIDDLLTQMQMKRIDLSRAVNIPVTTIKSWISSGSVPSAEAAYKVAKYFNVSVEWLITGKNSDNQQQDMILSSEEKTLVELFRHLDERDKNAVLTMVESLESQYASEDQQQNISG